MSTLPPEVTVGAATLRGITPENRRATIEVEGNAAPDLIRAACRHAFADLGLHRVQVWLVAGDPDVAAYETVGFMNEGVARDRVRRDGRWLDGVLLGLVHGELT